MNKNKACRPVGIRPSLMAWIVSASALILAGQSVSAQQAPPIGLAGRSEQAASGEEKIIWEVVFRDDFEGRSELGEEYAMKEQSQGGWKLENGVMVAKQNRPEHGTVLRRNLNFSDMRFQFDFRFTEQKQWANINVVFDDSKEKTVHSGHITRVSISRNRIYLSDDKLGSMNNDVRKMRKMEQRTPEQEKQLAERLAATSTEHEIDLSDDQWHHATVTVIGSKLHVEIDGREIASLDSPGNDHSTRDKFGLTVTGKFPIEFDRWVVMVPAGDK